MEVMPLHESQLTLAGDMMARAFFNEPLAVYMLPNTKQRAKLLPSHFNELLRHGYLFGESYVTGNNLDGVCVWIPPNQSELELAPERAKQAEPRGAHEALGQDVWERYLQLITHTETLRRLEVSPRHWFLALLAVNPLRQRQGIGKSLLHPVIQRADAEGLPAYLWTDQSSTVPFYQRHGFAVITDAVETNSGIRIWTMRREPQSSL
jgi:GNAT superfamily N-acetyltransferase